MIALTLVLCLFGMLMVFSASYYVALSKTGNPYEYLINDAMWMAIGWAGLVVFTMMDYHIIRVFSRPFLLVAMGLLVAVLTPLGTVINNASRWISIGPITLMPGEIVKTALIFFTACFYAEDPSKVTRWFYEDGNVVVAGWAAVSALLIIMEPNLSTAGIVVLLIGGMMVIAGLRWIYVGGLLGLGIAGFVAVVLSPRGEYMLTRVQTFFDPFKDALGEGYQVVQSLLAFGSGGLTGVGLGKSIQKTLYLPEPQSDFILPIIGEELGYVAVLALMAVYLLLIWRIIRIAIKAPDYLGTLLAGGIALHIALQVILNIAVVSATFFPTGVVLPFISLGGNATGLFLAEIGIVANISRQIKDEEEDIS